MRTTIKALRAFGLVAGAATHATPGAGAARAQGFYIDAPNVHVRVGHPHHWYYRHRGYARMPLTLAIPTATTTITAIGGAAYPITQSKAAFVSRIIMVCGTGTDTATGTGTVNLEVASN